MSRVPEAGGQPQEVVPFRTKVFSWGVLTDVLPDGRATLISSSMESSGRDYNDLAVHLADSGERRVLVEHGFDGRAQASGHLVFARGGNLMAALFDATTLAVRGQPVVAVSGVSVESLFGVAQFALSTNGVLAYVPGGDSSLGRLAWVDRHGRTEFLPVPERVYGTLSVAPDGNRVAVQVADVNDYVWLYVAKGTRSRCRARPLPLCSHTMARASSS